MTVKQMTEGISASFFGVDPACEVTGITNDSRRVEPGFVFAALPGADSGIHGLTYTEKALANGAVAVLSDAPAPGGVPYIKVDNAERAYALAAANLEGRPADSLRLVGVTGTNGKTTTTHLIHRILTAAGQKCGLIGTNEILIGEDSEPSPNTTPEGPALHRYFRRMAEAGCTTCVMEVSSHSLALGRVAGLTFAAAAFTNLTQDHLNYHKTMENYAAAKAEMFKQALVSVINVDSDYSETMLQSVTGKKVTFSAERDGADYLARNIRLLPSAVAFDCCGKNGLTPVYLGIPGKFSVENALTAFAVSCELGVPAETAAEALKTAPGVCGRAEIVPVDRDYTVMIDYAHSPDSLENILKTLRPCTKGRLITVFGCGGDRDRGKRPIMGRIAQTYSDFCVVTSDNPRTEQPEAIVAEIIGGMQPENRADIVNRVEAIRFALAMAKAGDIVLIAGKGHELYQEIMGVKHPFDEREIVRSILAEG